MSTLLRSLAALNDLDGGTISINGKDITKFATGKREIGMFFKQYSLFPNMTVEENILRLGLKCKNKIKAIIKEKVAQID